ncbi:SNF1 kinase complex beta-subunit [Mycena kentingensis (nom. inval.)]|nr:SNF1 kinase complex beta-subunit [Mycena kentingensis (nom. inval.)]
MGNNQSHPADQPPSTPRVSHSHRRSPPTSPDKPPSTTPPEPPATTRNGSITPDAAGASQPVLRPNRKSIELPGLNTFAPPANTSRSNRMPSRIVERGRTLLHGREGRHANGNNPNGSFTTNGSGAGAGNGRGRGPPQKSAAIAIPAGRRTGREEEESETGYGRHAQEGIARRKAELKAAEEERRRGRSPTRSRSRAADEELLRPTSPSPSTSPSHWTSSRASSRSRSPSRPRRNGDVAPHPSPDRSTNSEQERKRHEQLYGPPPTTAPPKPEFQEEIVFSTIPLTIGAGALIGGAEGDGEDVYDEEELEADADDLGGSARTRAVAAVVDEIVGSPVPIAWKGRGTDVYLVRAGDQDWQNQTKMERETPDGPFTTTVYLPPGTHHFRFIVDNATLVAPAEDIPNAVDDQGFITNYVTVPAPSAVSPTATSPDTSLPLIPIPPSVSASSATSTSSPARSASLRKRVRRPSQPTAPSPLHPDGSFWVNSSVGGSSEDVRQEDGVVGSRRVQGRNKVEWTSEIPPELVAAASQEEQWLDAQLAHHERQGHGMVSQNGFNPEPSIPLASRLPRHLERLILNRPSPGVVIPKVGTGAGNTGFSPNLLSPNHHRPLHPASQPQGPASPGPALRVTTASGTDVSLPSNSMVTGFATISENAPRRSSREGSPSSLAATGGTPLIADDPSVLQTPSHAVLHHLCTSSIKDKMIAVAVSTRYRQKYLTTVYYKPADLDAED